MTELSGPVPTEGFVVLKFYAPWCAPCRLLTDSVWPRLIESYPDVQFVEVNADEQPSVLQKYSVLSLPTVAFIKEGIEQYRIVGMERMAAYETAIATYK